MKRIVIFAILISCSLFIACSEQKESIDLTGPWTISDADITSIPAASSDTANLQKITLPGKLSPVRKMQVHWLQIRFTVPDALKDKDLSLFLGKVWDVDQTYLNGVKIGQTGSLHPSFFSSWNVDRCYTLPRTLLHYNNENTISVRVYSNQNALFYGKPFIAQTAAAEKHVFRMKFLAQYMPLAGGIVTLFFGFISLISFLLNRKDKVSLLYMGISFLWTIQSMHYYLPDFGMSYELHDQLYYILITLIGVLIYLFLERLLDEKNRYLTVFVIMLFVSASVMCLTATDADPMAGWRTDVMGIFGFVFQLIWLYVVIRRIHLRRAKIILVGCLFLGMSLIHDGLTISNVISSDFYWLNLGYPVLIIAFGLILSLVSAQNAKELEAARDTLQDYAEHLEEKVEERTRQLSAANSEIEAAMHETEALNESLVSSNRELEDAHRIAKMDMSMAFQVQKGFLPKTAPESDEWEIAFLFRPMSGVSGDFYDFYSNEGKLEGLSLFDVSGHGIASGLVTLLARSIIYREFTQRRDEKLSSMIESMNASITGEISNIDNYLTGIILRFKGDIVEYVNAGHTDLIMKKGSDGSVHIVKPRNRAVRGHFLGIKELQEKFDMIAFRAAKGDTLFLYSDCLTESADSKGEEYGLNRLLSVIEKIEPGTGAAEGIQAVVKDFYAFQGGEHLNDDLTMIVARRIV